MAFCHPKKIGSQTLLRFFAITPLGTAERIKILIVCYSPTIGSQQCWHTNDIKIVIVYACWPYQVEIGTGINTGCIEIGSGEFAPPQKKCTESYGKPLRNVRKSIVH